MYHPSTRLLTILELLQIHPHMSGEDLARRLEVEPRTVRRYIQMLQDMGMPVEGTRGPGGGYRLRPGFKLPPLLFTEEEATAIVLGLLSTALLEIDISSVSLEGALAKTYRVLPLRGRERLQALASHMVPSPHQNDNRPDISLLITLSEAINTRQRVAFAYNSHHNELTHREIEPYGMAARKGNWYVVGLCCLRKDYRLFRLDRMHSVTIQSTNFERDPHFDYQAFVIKRLDTIPARWLIKVEFQADLYTMQQKIPSTHGQLTATPNGTLFESHHVSLSEMAHYLIGRNVDFTVLEPPELRDALLALAARITHIATTNNT